jgi:undecaprenyl-diphosphatase
LLVVVLLVAVAGFAGLALAHQHDPLAGWDESLARWIARELPTWVEWLARPFSWLGGWIGITAVTVVACVLLLRERSWLDLGVVLAVVLGSQLLVTLLKSWFDRPRPTVGPVVPLPSSLSFPSGHAATGAACLGVLAVLLAQRMTSRQARTWLWTLVAALAVAIGLSRIALGVHYLSDVLAGWCLGIAWLAACLLVRETVRS